MARTRALHYQQNVSRFDLTVVLLRARSNAYEDLAPLMDEVNRKLEYAKPGTVLRIPSAR